MQLLADGVIVIVPLIMVLPELVVVNDGTLPVPLAPKPIAVLLLAQLKADPDTGPVIVVDVAVTPVQ